MKRLVLHSDFSLFLLVSQEDHSDSDCFILAMSSHGDELLEEEKSKSTARVARTVREDIVFCTDFYMTTRQLVFPFTDTNCPTLKGKPRLFFLQVHSRETFFEVFQSLTLC